MLLRVREKPELLARAMDEEISLRVDEPNKSPSVL